MGRPIGKRYEHPDGEDRASVTPSRIRRLGREAQVQLIAQWFLSLYHDPSNETPYNGREGDSFTSMADPMMRANRLKPNSAIM